MLSCLLLAHVAPIMPWRRSLKFDGMVQTNCSSSANDAAQSLDRSLEVAAMKQDPSLCRLESNARDWESRR
jgi:hypothetical protein